MSFLNENRRWLAFLLLAQLAMMVIVQPTGSFPVNDDWAFAHSVEWLLAEGRVRLSDWVIPNIVPQTLMGALVANVWGFSFDALRHLTQAVSLLNGFAAFFLFRTARLSAAHATVACLVLVATPFWSILANSYMTDMYGLMFALIGAALFLQALKDGSTRLLMAATIVVCIGMLQRQVILALPFAFMLGWLREKRRRTVSGCAIGILPLAAAIATGLAFHQYLASGPGIPTAQLQGHGRFLPLLLKLAGGDHQMLLFVWTNLATMVGYLGLFLVGWCLWWGGYARRRVAIVLTLLGAAAALATGWLPPYLENNTVDAAGIGPFTLHDAWAGGVAELQRQPGLLWRVAGVAAVAGVVGLGAMALKIAARVAGRGESVDGELVFLLAAVAAYLGPFLITGYFDRYLLFALPFAILVWSRVWPPDGHWRVAVMQRSLALGWIAVVLVLSSVATHDYFAWNRARWEAIVLAEKMGATPDTMDGGFEYNGYHRFEQKPRTTSPGKRFWWIKDDEFVVAFTPVAGYEVVERFPVDRRSGRVPAEVVLLKRLESVAGGAGKH